MKRLAIPIFVSLLAAFSARADTALTLGSYNGCVNDLGPNSIPNPPTLNGSFDLPGVSGSGTLQSQVPSFYYANFQDPNVKEFIYNYTIDLSGMSPTANHCVRLVIHFGEPSFCGFGGSDIACNTNAVQSATLAPFGDITFVFAGGCLNPGQSSVLLGMLSWPGTFKTNVVTVIDDYTDPSSGLTNEVKINVPAIVPDIPPNPPPWEIAAYYSRPIATIQYQGGIGSLVTNYVPPPLPTNWDFLVQLVDPSSNGLAFTPMTTQTVQTVKGLFNLPLPFDPISYGGATPGSLSISVRPTGVSTNPFTPLKPPSPNNPTPQALYAYSAGTVADLMPGQAVTSLNGMTGALLLVASTGITLNTNGNTITISAAASSDRNLKTDIVPVNAETVLARLTTMPIESWRFTNDVAGVRHVGPLAQDFKAAFGLGNSDRMIGYLDASGVALAAVQGLNQKLVEGFQQQDEQDADLEQQIQSTRQILNQINQKLSGGEK